MLHALVNTTWSLGRGHQKVYERAETGKLHDALR